jgi:quinol monooxygenase YgiN
MDMDNSVCWMLELDIQAGEESTFRALMEEMVGATRANEPGTLAYEWHTSADGRVCHLYERYVDSAAAMTHVKTFGEKFARRFLAVLKPTRLVVYGAPDATLKDALAALNPVYMEPVGGFSR